MLQKMRYVTITAMAKRQSDPKLKTQVVLVLPAKKIYSKEEFWASVKKREKIEKKLKWSPDVLTPSAP